MPVIDDKVDVNGMDPDDALEAARIAAEGGESVPAADESDESEIEASEQAAPEEVPAEGGDVASDDAEPVEAAPKGGKPEAVPYGRFKEAIDDKNELKRQLADAKAQLAQAGRPQTAPQAGVPQTGVPAAQPNGAVDFLRQAIAPALQEQLDSYMAPFKAQMEENQRTAFKAQHAGRIDDDVVELAWTKFKLAEKMGMVQRNPDGTPTLTPDDVIAAEVGRLVMSGVNVSHARAAASRAAVQQVNKGAVTPTRGRGRTSPPKFDPNDPNVDPDQLLEYARTNGIEGL